MLEMMTSDEQVRSSSVRDLFWSQGSFKLG